MSLIKELFNKPTAARNEFGATTVFHKRRFGSNYPSLSYETKKKLAPLILLVKRSSKKFSRSIEHPDLHYKALNIINKNGW